MAGDGLKQRVLERGVVLALVVLATYLWLAPTHVVAGDNAEFATLGALGGRAHPSGYPLYVLWLRAMAWLPAATAAHRASLATALLAGVQVLVLHAACRAWGARPAAATLAVAVFAAAPIVLRVHTEADVFALNSLVASTILWLAAANGPLRGTRRAAALALVAGLGLANNQTCVLLAPIGIYGVLRGLAEAPSRPRALAAALAAFAAGLSPYAYLALAPEPASFGAVHSLRDLLAIVLRRDYGTFTHLPGAAHVALATTLREHAALIGRTWLWAPALLGLAVLAARAVRTEGGAERAAWILLAASWLLAGPLLAWRLQLPTDSVARYIGGRMQIMSAVVLAVPIAIGLDGLLARAGRRLAPAAATGAATAVFAGLVLAAWPRLHRVHSAAVEAGVRNLLASLPPRAIALVVSDDQCFGARYLQLVDHVRPDATVVCWTLASRAWYRARLAAAGVPLAETHGGPASAAQADALLATGRPLLVDDAQAQILAARPSYPEGLLQRVLARGAPLPALGAVVEENRTLFAHIELDDPRPQRDDDFAAVAHRRYAATWVRLAKALVTAGDRAGAQAALDVARALAPAG